MPKHINSLSLLQLILAGFLYLPALGNSQPKEVVFELYPADSNLGRSDLQFDETHTARPALTRQAKHIFQVFMHKRTGCELFRAEVGTTESEYWVYGLVREADFNGDGIPDFSWYAGDDTGEEKLLVLSSPNGYRKVDVEASLSREWRRRFPSDPGMDQIWDTTDFQNIKLVRRGGRLVLQGHLKFEGLWHDDTPGETYERSIRVREER